MSAVVPYMYYHDAGAEGGNVVCGGSAAKEVASAEEREGKERRGDVGEPVEGSAVSLMEGGCRRG